MDVYVVTMQTEEGDSHNIVGVFSSLEIATEIIAKEYQTFKKTKDILEWYSPDESVFLDVTRYTVDSHTSGFF